MSGAHVASVTALERLESVLRRHSATFQTAVEALALDFRRRREKLSEIERHATADVWECRQRLAHADEDEQDDAQAALDDALARCAHVEGWRRRVEACATQFTQRATRHIQVDANELRRGLAKLASSIELLRQYDAIHPEDTGAPTTAGAIETVAVDTPGPAAPTLPKGFVWMPLAQIDERELEGVQSAADFKKVSYQQMRDGMQTLKESVLPLMAAHVGERPSEVLEARDREAGLDYEHGSLRVYEAFFGEHDFVYLSRGRHDEKFTIQNGRHRVKVARDLGWDAIPAQVKDLRHE